MKNKLYLIISFFISIGLLPMAFYIEYYYHALPCELCWYERYIYIILIFISIFFWVKESKYTNKIMLFIWIIMCLLSFYHILVENDIVQSSCSSGIFVNNNALPTNKFIPCNIVNFYIFGLSLASYNMIISLCMILYFIILNKKENKK